MRHLHRSRLTRLLRVLLPETQMDISVCCAEEAEELSLHSPRPPGHLLWMDPGSLSNHRGSSPGFGRP